jgi:hypothetical protein
MGSLGPGWAGEGVPPVWKIPLDCAEEEAIVDCAEEDRIVVSFAPGSHVLRFILPT